MTSTTMFDSVLMGSIGDVIAQKVRKTHAPSVQGRGFAEYVHGYQLVEKLLPVCREHGLCIELFDGEEEYTPITSPEQMIQHMKECDTEYLLIYDGEIERDEDNDNTFISIVLVYGNCADDAEIGRGEMVADWGGVTEWFNIFDPVIDDFVNAYYINKNAEEVTV